MSKTKLLITSVVFLAIALMLFSCKKDEEIISENTKNTIPTTYNFDNVNYSGQTYRLIMLDSIGNYLKLAHIGQIINADKLKSMYANSNNPFNNLALDTSGKQLKNKTYQPDQIYFELLMDSAANLSLSANQTGSSGKSGLVSSKDGSKTYLFNEKGIEYTQVILKHLMGAIFYYQLTENYLSKLPLVDNNTVVTGEGTTMEHYCDEAFGYLGVANDFPNNKLNLRHWGEYTDKLDSKINCSQALMQAFIKLRAAISSKDYSTRDEQIKLIKSQLDKIVAASAILELTQAKLHVADDALRNHYLSEALGFIKSMAYNSQKQISNSQINLALNALGDNFYQISTTNINNAINIINSTYGFDLSKF